MSKFKVGDRVRRTEYNATGEVVGFIRGDVAVQFDAQSLLNYATDRFYIDGKAYRGIVNGACNWELIASAPTPYELHITCNDGKTTNAVYKVNGKIEKRTEAVCAPSDTFNFNTGAELAINRVLHGTDYNPKDVALKTPACATQPIAPQEDKPKFAKGDKVKFIKSKFNFKRDYVGKTYEIKNLQGEDIDGYRYGIGELYIATEDELEPYAEPEKEPEPVYYSGKVVFYGDEGSICFIPGTVYNFQNGVCKDKNGHTFAGVRPIKSFADLIERCEGNQFIPYLGEA